MRLGVKLTRLPMLFLTQMHAPHSHWARTQPQLKYSPRFLMKVPVFMAKNPDSFFKPLSCVTINTMEFSQQGWESPHFSQPLLFQESWAWSPALHYLAALGKSLSSSGCCMPVLPPRAL